MTNQKQGGGGFKDWQQLRDHLTTSYTEAPHPTTEAEIVAVYAIHPAALTKAALSLIGNPDIRSHWAVLRSRATQIATAPSNPTAATGANREKAIARAEQWIRNAGLHYDQPDEIIDELFGTRGNLHPYRADETLTTHLLDVWANHRPTGIQIERDADERAQKWKQDTARLARMKGAITQPDDGIPF